VIIQVRGHLATKSDGKVQVTLPIGDDSSVSDIHRMCTSDNSACRRPRDACTDVVLLEHGFYHDEAASKLLLIPHTGTLQCTGCSKLLHVFYLRGKIHIKIILFSDRCFFIFIRAKNLCFNVFYFQFGCP